MGRKTANATIDSGYFDLVRRFPLKPLRSEEDLDTALGIINELIDRGFEDLSPGEEAYLDVLSDLVEKYEEEQHPIPEATPAMMLQFFMEDRKLNQRAVARGSGIPASSISEVLAGRRQMTLDQMQKLGKFFGVSPALFMPEARKRRKTSRKTVRQ